MTTATEIRFPEPHEIEGSWAWDKIHASEAEFDTVAKLVDHLRKGWIFGGHLSRILAVLSASYLIWRVWRGRRPSPIPPWKKPSKAA